MGFLTNMIGNMKEKAKQKEHDKIVSCMEKAEKGDRASKLMLAKYYSGISDLTFLESNELAIDDKKAYEIFCDLARRYESTSPYSECGEEAAYYAIQHIIEGKGTARNYMKAISYLDDLSAHSDSVFYGAKKCKKNRLNLRNILEKELKEDPDNAEAAYFLAYLYYGYCNDFAEATFDTPPESFMSDALEMALKAQRVGNKNAVFLAARIKGHGKIDLLKTTQSFAELGVPEALNAMAQNMIKVQKNYEKGIEYAEEYLQFEDEYCYNREEIKFLLGFAYYMTDNYEKAEKMFIDTSVLKPDLTELSAMTESYNFLGRIYENHKSNSPSDLSKALAYYERSMNLGSQSGKEHYEQLSRKTHS